MLQLNKEYATVEVNCDKSQLKLTWLRQPTEEEFKEAFTIGLKAAQEHSLKYFLSDNSIGINMDMALQRWASTYGAEVLGNLKLERYARVIPADAIQEVVSYKMFDKVLLLSAGSLELRAFHDVKEAEDWLYEGVERGSKPTDKYK